jgi:hypothetical protein
MLLNGGLYASFVTFWPLWNGNSPNWIGGGIAGVVGATVGYGIGMRARPEETIAVNGYTLRLDYYI